MTKCAKLQKLILGSRNSTNTNLVSLSLGNNTLLRELDLTNCPNLTGNLSLSGCTDLRKLTLTGTNVTGFDLGDSPVIEELYLPSSLTTLTLKHIKTLTVLSAKSFNNIRTLIYEDSTYSLEDILSKCGKINRMRIFLDNDYSYNLDIDGFMYYYDNAIGLDEHGYNLPHPFWGGTINIEIQAYHTQEEIDDYKETINNYYTSLGINYIDIPSKITAFW